MDKFDAPELASISSYIISYLMMSWFTKSLLPRVRWLFARSSLSHSSFLWSSTTLVNYCTFFVFCATLFHRRLYT